MKYLVMFIALMILASCSTPRVLVEDCQEAGPGLKNCKKVKEL